MYLKRHIVSDIMAEEGESSFPGDIPNDVCRDYMRNVCSRGQKCRFKHPDRKLSKLEYISINHIYIYIYLFYIFVLFVYMFPISVGTAGRGVKCEPPHFLVRATSKCSSFNFSFLNVLWSVSSPSPFPPLFSDLATTLHLIYCTQLWTG